MKIRTNIKAGGQGNQHNEKLMDNNNDSTEHGKSFIKKLSLKKETIRELKQLQLKGIVGGDLTQTVVDCVTRVDCFTYIRCTINPC